MKQKYTRQQEKVTFLRMLRAELNTLAAKASGPQVREQILSFADTVGCSDPMSSDALENLEMRVKDNISLLREELEEGSEEDAVIRLRKLQALWTERNEKCAVLKHRR